jgi:hypothetical protein
MYWQIGVNISEEAVSPIFLYPEDGSSRFF